MTTIGIDIGGRTHVAARCRDSQARADREILRVSQNRAGFTALDAWLQRQPEPVTLVTMESSGHSRGSRRSRQAQPSAGSCRTPRSWSSPPHGSGTTPSS